MEKTGQDIRDFYEMLAERRQVSNAVIIVSYFFSIIFSAIKLSSGQVLNAGFCSYQFYPFKVSFKTF